MKTAGEVARDGAPVIELADYFKRSAEALPPPSAVETLVMMKRAQDYLKAGRTHLLLSANREYNTLRELQPDVKQHIIMGGAAFLKAFTPRPVWEYPPELQQEIDDVKAKQKRAQESGAATKKPVSTDMETTAYFSMTLNEKFE